MSLREAAELALDALHANRPKISEGDAFAVILHDRAVTALKAALAEDALEPTVPSDCANSHQPVAWTDADADAARLAMELEALLLSTKDTAAVSRWWDSAHDALELHRQRLSQAIEAARGIIDSGIQGDKA